MSIWSRLAEFVSRATTDAFAAVVESVRTVLEGDPDTRRQVAFSIALIALSAKMAKADGIVTRPEVDAFKEIFSIPEADAVHVARLYDLAKQDVAGFGAYARRIRDLFPGDSVILADVMDGMFHIAKADGLVHEKEMAFLDRIAEVFGLDERLYGGIRMRHLHAEDGDPFDVIGASREWGGPQLKAHYRKLVKENHPDSLIARGVPEEFVTIANARLATINKSWDAIRRERSL